MELDLGPPFLVAPFLGVVVGVGGLGAEGGLLGGVFGLEALFSTSVGSSLALSSNFTPLTDAMTFIAKRKDLSSHKEVPTTKTKLSRHYKSSTSSIVRVPVY